MGKGSALCLIRSVCQFGNIHSQKTWFWSLCILFLFESMLPRLYGYLIRAVLNAWLDCWRPLISDTLLSLQFLHVKLFWSTLQIGNLACECQFPVDPQKWGTDPGVPILKANPGRKNPSCARIYLPQSRRGSTLITQGPFQPHWGLVLIPLCIDWANIC